MALILADRVRETSTSTGTGPMVLDGPVEGYVSFASMGMDGAADTTYYTIVNTTNAEWEVGVGYYFDGQLIRIAAISNSSGTYNFIPFTAGGKDVFVSLTALTATAIPQYNVRPGSIPIAPGEWRHIIDSGMYTVSEIIFPGVPRIRVTKTPGVTPTIKTTLPTLFRTSGGDVDSILYDIDAELVLAYNQPADVWEL